MIIIEKDRHMRRQAPFFQAHIKLNDWYLSNEELNNEDTSFISLGDWYNIAIPSPEEIDETERFFTTSKFKNIYLSAGNHDYSDSLKTYSILPLRNNPRITIITEPCVKVIDGKTFAFLPHLQKGMREVYSNLSNEFINADYVLYHIDDETVKFGKKKTGIDLSYLKGKRIGGHIHTMQKNYELGMPITSNFAEKGQQVGYYAIYNDEVETWVDTPRLVDYYNIEYGEPIPEVEAPFPIFDIYNAPSKKQAEKFYKDIFIHDIFVVNKKKESIKAAEKKSSITEFFSDYIKDRSDIKDWALLRLKNLVEKK